LPKDAIKWVKKPRLSIGARWRKGTRTDLKYPTPTKKRENGGSCEAIGSKLLPRPEIAKGKKTKLKKGTSGPNRKSEDNP